jgi:hypothetical protein
MLRGKISSANRTAVICAIFRSLPCNPVWLTLQLFGL